MTKEEFKKFENITQDEIISILGISEFIEDEYILFQLCIERHIKPHYENYTYHDAFDKVLEESHKIQYDEISFIKRNSRNRAINQILDIKEEKIDLGDFDFFSDFNDND